MQFTTCSPWGSLVKSFPSLQKKMNAYMEDRSKIANLFTQAQRPNNRQNLFPFTKKTNSTKRSKSDSKKGSKKHQKSRKIEGHYMSTKAVMPTFTLSPAIVSMTPTIPNLPATPKLWGSAPTTSCEMQKPWGRPCPMYTKPAPPMSPPHSDWSDEDWDGERKRDEREGTSREAR